MRWLDVFSLTSIKSLVLRVMIEAAKPVDVGARDTFSEQGEVTSLILHTNPLRRLEVQETLNGLWTETELHATVIFRRLHIADCHPFILM
jgi:hypothetical protein